MRPFKRSRDWKQWLVAVENDLSKLPDLVNTSKPPNANSPMPQMPNRFATRTSCVRKLQSRRWLPTRDRASSALDDHIRTRPGWLSRLFRTPPACRWQQLADALRIVYEVRE